MMEMKKFKLLTKEDLDRIEKFKFPSFDVLVDDFLKPRSYEEWKELKQAEEDAKRRCREFEGHLSNFDKGWYELRYERGE